jgi:taspase, threonine aspartase, 1
VPPNLLVGDGATSFAWEHNVNVVPHDALVSKGARERFLKWKDDLYRANRSRLTPEASSPAGSSYGGETVDLDYEEGVRNQQRRDHTNAMLSGTWNEGQPDSPRDTPSAHLEPYGQSEEHAEYRKLSPRSTEIDSSNFPCPNPGHSFLYRLSPIPPASGLPNTRRSRDGASPPKRARYGTSQSSDGQSRTHSLLGRRGLSAETSKSPAGVDVNLGDMQTAHKTSQAEGADGPTSPVESDSPSPDNSTSRLPQETTPLADQIVDEDFITDTVGAIAIDIFGNIAAGSSSGGIGMKHCGRVGPAALVGIGTAVIPLDPMDQEGITVAAVTSGTGEHMATTMASQKCAERLYFSTRRGPGGQNITATEEESMHSFIQDDFMDHPGVKNGHSGGAIGVMAVKKTSHGFYLHFAHNTDSFALASMHSNEKEPKCVMSRIGERSSSVVQGARKIRIN